MGQESERWISVWIYFALLAIGKVTSQVSPGTTSSSELIPMTTSLYPLTTPIFPVTTAPAVVTTSSTPLIDFCAQNPCQNGGTCTNTSTNYTCSCLNGYFGTNCESRTISYEVETEFRYFEMNGKNYTAESPEFKNTNSSVARAACAALRKSILAALPSAVRVHCLSFDATSGGLLNVKYVVEFHPNTTTNATTVASTIAAALSQNSYRFTDEAQILVAGPGLSLAKASDYNECLRNISGYCDESAVCQNLIGSYTCVCPSGTFFQGRVCILAGTGQDNEIIAIYAAMGTLSGLLLLLALLICCLTLGGGRGVVLGTVEANYFEARPIGLRANSPPSDDWEFIG